MAAAALQLQQQESGLMISSTSSGASEIVYGTERGSMAGSDESRVMSEKVQQLASAIYKEFELMIEKSGENSVKDLMPLVVNVLESLDLAYLEKEECEVEVELLKEDNEQLVTQYEREKQLRRQIEGRCLEVEDHLEGEQKHLQDKIESLESIVRMLELKSKNSGDHANRLEEREAELKSEYQKLHDRYTDIFKTHMDYMERTKFLMGNEKFDMIQSMPSSELRTAVGMATSIEGPAGLRSASDVNSPTDPNATGLPSSNFQALSSQIHGHGDWNEEFSPTPASEILGSEGSSFKLPRDHHESESSSNIKKEDMSADDSLGADLTGGLVDPAEFASAGKDSDADTDYFLHSPVNASGMGREVENLIKENTELLETKNALNIVKNDLIAKLDELTSEHEIVREEISSLEVIRTKLNDRVRELEEELKSVKEKLEEVKKSKEDEDDIPMAQRKRFTRVEMARVLMERNQYKEKLMELQEAVKWTEMIRASKAESGSRARKKGSIWDFFSGLFSGAETGTKPTKDSTTVRYTNKSSHPDSDPLQRRKSDKQRKTLDFLDPEYSSEKRAAERREQYKLVKAHVKKDESGRLQAYGWSIPAMDNKQPTVTVPVPIFCRPLISQEQNLKIWCASGVLLCGGRTKDGGYIVGGDSVFYSNPPPNQQTPPSLNKPVERLDYEIREQQQELREFEQMEWESSSLMWVCSSAHGRSQVAIIDANNPSHVFDNFDVCTSHVLCTVSVPGAKESDYPTESNLSELFCREGTANEDDETTFNGKVIWSPLLASHDDPISFESPALAASPKRTRAGSVGGGGSKRDVVSLNTVTELVADIIHLKPDHQDVELAADAGETATDQDNSSQKNREFPDYIKDGLAQYSGLTDITTVLPTMWMGSQNGIIYIHSAVNEWRKCLRKVRLDDAVLGIVHYKGRVFAALANGTLVVFHRDKTGEWSMAGHHVITVGKPQTSVRCITVVAGRVWCGYRNSIYVFSSKDFTLETCFAAHPRKDSQVRQLVWVGDGVWCSIRLDSTLRLYHAHTYQHMQDVDIEPYVSKMLGTNKLGFSFIRTTALLVSCRRLWIGTGTGVIISVPLSETNETRVSSGADSSGGDNPAPKVPGGLIRVYSDPAGTDRVSPGTFIPYCNMAQAQLSFHGHKDAVKFFLSVPGSRPKSQDTKPSDDSNTSTNTDRRMMVVSGGDGYIDFRVGEDDEEAIEEQRKKNGGVIVARDMSHLIVWEVNLQN